MSGGAYWIDRRGKIIAPDSRHIITVVKHPEWFGETPESIKKVFNKHNEPINTNVEGKAREEIMTKLIKKGFIRIRQSVSRRDQRWSIQLNKLTSKVGDVLWGWANKMINDKIAKDKFADVTVHQLSNNKMMRTTLDRIATGETIRESLGKRRVLLKEETDKIKIYTEEEYMKEKSVIYKHLK